MHERYDLNRMLLEIEEDESADPSKKGRLSQDDIRRLVAQKRKAKEKKVDEKP